MGIVNSNKYFFASLTFLCKQYQMFQPPQMACLHIELFEWHVTPSCQVLFIIHPDLSLGVTLGVVTWSWQSTACRQQEWATQLWCPCWRSSAAGWRLPWSPGPAAWYSWAGSQSRLCTTPSPPRMFYIGNDLGQSELVHATVHRSIPGLIQDQKHSEL